MARVHTCQENLCRAIVPIGDRYCPIHKPLHQQYSGVSKEEKRQLNKSYNLYQRDEQADKFYHSKQWTKVRNYVVSRDGATSAISNKVLNDKDIIVDHIHPRRLVKDPLNTDNLWLLSRSEHNVKTKLEQAIEASDNGRNKLRHMTKETWTRYLKERIK